MESYRLFIAAPLPPPVKIALASAQERLKNGGAPLKWVAPAAMHLTLHFLGETDPARLPQIAAALREGCAGARPQRLWLAGVGAFPTLRRPSVVWAGVSGDTAELGRLAASVKQVLAQIGLAGDERPFRAHLTLGRVRRDATPAALAQLSESIRALPQLPPAEWLSDRVALFRSELRREGPAYTALETIAL